VVTASGARAEAGTCKKACKWRRTHGCTTDTATTALSHWSSSRRRSSLAPSRRPNRDRIGFFPGNGLHQVIEQAGDVKKERLDVHKWHCLKLPASFHELQNEARNVPEYHGYEGRTQKLTLECWRIPGCGTLFQRTKSERQPPTVGRKSKRREFGTRCGRLAQRNG